MNARKLVPAAAVLLVSIAISHAMTGVEYFQGINPNTLSEFQGYPSSIRLGINALVHSYVTGQGDRDTRMTNLRQAVQDYLGQNVAYGTLTESQVYGLQGYMGIEALHELALHDQAALSSTFVGEWSGFQPPSQQPDEQTKDQCMANGCTICGGLNKCVNQAGMYDDCPPGKAGYCDVNSSGWLCVFAAHASCFLGCYVGDDPVTPIACPLL